MARRRHVLKHPLKIRRHRYKAGIHEGSGEVGGLEFRYMVDDTGRHVTVYEVSRNARFVIARVERYLKELGL